MLTLPLDGAELAMTILAAFAALAVARALI